LKENWTAGNYNAYVACTDQNKVIERLKEVPEELREQVTRHARLVWKLRNDAKKYKRQQ